MRSSCTTSLARALLATAACMGASACSEPVESTEPDPNAAQRIVDSRPYHIDQIYRSMEGPIGRVITPVGVETDASKAELYWITGIQSEVVDPQGDESRDGGFMCHTNVSFARFTDHHQIFYPGQKPHRSHPRIFTLSQGQFSVSFPAGFGIPMLSTEPLAIDTQALNLNDPKTDETVRIRTTIDYVRDEDLERPMHPLIQRAAQGSVLIAGKDGYHGVSEGDPDTHGPGCQMGTPQTASNMKDPFGRVFAAHWQVPPGREVNHSLVTSFMAIPYDTTVHFVAVHLHPFATSLELRDLTTDTTVFRSNARGPETGIGLEHVEAFSSEEGIPIYADHEYELVSVYENTTDDVQDSMATMLLYLLDRDFVKPAL